MSGFSLVPHLICHGRENDFIAWLITPTEKGQAVLGLNWKP